jgi:hypothetical protein
MKRLRISPATTGNSYALPTYIAPRLIISAILNLFCACRPPAIARLVVAIIALFTLCATTKAQVAVSLSPEPKLQFFSNNGVPLAGGCVFSYAAGTSTPQATYVDSTGLTASTNPIILDAGGRASIWLTSQGYKLVLFSAGGVACATGTQIWSVDGITGQLGLLSLSNTWSGVQTFSQPIKITPSVNQLVLGTSPNTTTLNAPAPAGAITLTFPITTDTLVGRNTTDTLTNKTLTSPVINGGTFSGNVVSVFNNNTGVGTGLNQIAKLTTVSCPTASACAIVTATTDTGGAIGVCISTCGNGPTSSISTVGQTPCIFDGATTAGDYVQISSTLTGTCHDSGSATFPTSGGQVIGRVLLTGAGGVTAIDLFPNEIRPLATPPIVVTAANTTGLVANVSSTPLVTPSVNGFYRASCYLVITQAATISSTLPVCSVTYNDGDANTAATQNLTTTSSTNTVGTSSALGASIPYFFAKSGVAISYQTTGYATSGATSMAYALHFRLEGPF